MTWRTVSIVLGLACCGLVWRDCARPAAKPKPRDQELETSESVRSAPGDRPSPGEPSAANESARSVQPEAGGLAFHGFQIPAWAMRLAPHPGENLVAYRDRMVPLAKAAVAPHRVRVARGRDEFAAIANLDPRQRAELEAAVRDAAAQIQDRVIDAALGGELSPASFKPMTAVALVRDVLDAVDQANKRFLGSLRDDQRAKLAQHPFDFADYLVFSTKWEEALGIN